MSSSTPSPSIVAALTEKIGGYEALPLLDTEYNHPEVQHMVLRMIQEEMKVFQPPKDNYLSALPYPKLKFSNAPGFAQEYERIKSSQGSSVGGQSNGDTYAMKKQIDMSRYNVRRPCLAGIFDFCEGDSGAHVYFGGRSIEREESH